MEKALYTRLVERMNQFDYSFALVDPYVELLSGLYSKEHAELAADMPEGAQTVSDLAKTLNRNEADLTRLLEEMADNGAVYLLKAEDGSKKYELIPFLPGYFEIAVNHSDDDKARWLWKKYGEMKKELNALRMEKIEKGEGAGNVIPVPYARTITINEALPDNAEAYPFERIKQIVEEQTSFGAQVCTCRRVAGLTGTPCKADVPEYSCLSFGDLAEFLIDRKLAKRISKDECLDMMKTCSEKGLVHNANNYTEKFQFMCNCCSCCCGILSQVRALGKTLLVNKSNFLTSVDADSCIGCGDCVERCPVEALRLEDEVAVVNHDLCLGCGNCALICPSESITMERWSHDEPVLDGRRRVGWGF